MEQPSPDIYHTDPSPSLYTYQPQITIPFGSLSIAHGHDDKHKKKPKLFSKAVSPDEVGRTPKKKKKRGRRIDFDEISGEATVTENNFLLAEKMV